MFIYFIFTVSSFPQRVSLCAPAWKHGRYPVVSVYFIAAIWSGRDRGTRPRSLAPRTPYTSLDRRSHGAGVRVTLTRAEAFCAAHSADDAALLIGDVTAEFGHEPFLRVLLCDLVLIANSSRGVLPLGYSKSRSGEHNIEVHAVNSDAGVILEP